MFDEIQEIYTNSSPAIYLYVTEKLLLGPSSEPNMCRMDNNDVEAAVFNFIRSSGRKLLKIITRLRYSHRQLRQVNYNCDSF